jgi:hypothetical protein
MEAVRPGSGLSRSIVLHRDGWVGVGASAAALAIGAVALDLERKRMSMAVGRRRRQRRPAGALDRQGAVLFDIGVAAFYNVSGRAVVGVSRPTAIGLVVASQEEPDVISVFFGAALLLILVIAAAR